LAAVLGVSVRTLAALEAARVLIPAQPGKGRRGAQYDLTVAVPAYLAYQAAQRPTSGSARERRDHAQAALAEYTLQVRRREYLLAADVGRAWVAQIAGARALILAAWVECGDRVHRAAVTAGLPGVQRELQAVGRQILTELAAQPATLACPHCGGALATEPTPEAA
jgi:hypothetical protein